MILTPEQIEPYLATMKHCPDDNNHRVEMTPGCAHNLADTLVAYAEVVERLSESDFPGRVWRCPFCPAILDDVPPEIHAPDCTYLAARRLRGKP